MATTTRIHEQRKKKINKTEKDYEKQTKYDRKFSSGVREVLFEGILFKLRPECHFLGKDSGKGYSLLRSHGRKFIGTSEELKEY